MLRCFPGVHLQDVLLLERRFDCYKGQVFLVSVKCERSMIEFEGKLLE